MAARMRGVDRGAQAQVALHALAAQVDVAVAQAHRLVDVVAVVERERRRLGLGEDLDRRSRRARPRRCRGSALTVPSGRCAHRAGHAQDVLAAHVDGAVDDALDDARCGRAGRRRRGARRARAACATQPHTRDAPRRRRRRAATPQRSVAHGVGRIRRLGRHRELASSVSSATAVATSLRAARRRASRSSCVRCAGRGPYDRRRPRAPRARRCSASGAPERSADLHLGLHRAAVEGAVGRAGRPRAARSSRSRRDVPAGDVDTKTSADRSTGLREARPRRRRRAAPARSRCRTRCPASACPPSGSTSPS